MSHLTQTLRCCSCCFLSFLSILLFCTCAAHAGKTTTACPHPLPLPSSLSPSPFQEPLPPLHLRVSPCATVCCEPNYLWIVSFPLFGHNQSNNDELNTCHWLLLHFNWLSHLDQAGFMVLGDHPQRGLENYHQERSLLSGDFNPMNVSPMDLCYVLVLLACREQAKMVLFEEVFRNI